VGTRIINTQMKKQIISLLIVFGIILSINTSHAQSPKLQLFPEYGNAFNLLNKKVYSGNSLNSSPQLGGALRVKLGNKISLGLELQKRSFSLDKNILDTYSQIPNQNPFAGTEEKKKSKTINALAGIYFNNTNKRQTNLFEIGLSGGLQKLNLKANTLTFNNPFQLGAVDILYSNKAQKSTKPMAQLSLSNTFFIKKTIGLRFGVKMQYAPNLYETSYKDISQNLSFQEFCNAATITQTTYNPISIVPTVGLVIPIGFGKSKAVENKPIVKKAEKISEKKEQKKEDNNKRKAKNECFGLKWNNATKNGTCISEDKLKFTISMATGITNIVKYEVYLAPVSDLDNKVLLFNLPYPSTTFNINTLSLELGKEYFVIVKMYYRDENFNCAQVSGPIRRCDKCCLDKTSDGGFTPKGSSIKVNPKN
jgi:hypothetical protein